MDLHSWSPLTWIKKSSWRERTEKIADRVDQAAESVGRTNAEVRRATFDHADSVEHVRTTVEAVLDRLERRGLSE